MGKKRAGPSAAIAPAAGTKMTFGDDDDFDYDAPSSSGVPSDAPSENDESGSESDSDSDAAPEAVGMRTGAADERKRAAAEEGERQAKREAAKLRAARVAEAKAASKKAGKPKDKRKRAAEPSDGEESEEEDAEAARLRRRMEAAMAAGEDSDDSMESDFDEEGQDDFDALDEEEEGEEGEEDDDEDEETGEEEEEEEESDDEGLLSRPVPAALKSRMDAMMAAMEGRAMAADPKFADEMASRRKKGPVLEVPSLKSGPKGVKTTFDEFGEYEAAPLSADMLAAADAQLAADKSKEKVERGEERARKRRRKGKKAAPTARVLDDRTVHLLPPVLAGTALPPIVGPRERVGTAGKAQATFYKNAMKASGKIPGRGVVDGRRR
ncbi:hypothetical protein CspHIS471_0601570 [Cutaneotrichosporon sp. HIS471]|nr:hypothetical protein CspHIS471_0601570 [Cutaneotrichosporon sp. HIS471]